MKIKKRISIVADILVDEDFDTNYLCICEMMDMADSHYVNDIFLGESDNFEILDYISQDAVELVSELCPDCKNNSSEKCNHCFDGDEENV